MNHATHTTGHGRADLPDRVAVAGFRPAKNHMVPLPSFLS